VRDLLKKLLNGRYRGEELTLIKNAFEAVGEYKAGKISEHELACFQLEACPGAGACQGLGIGGGVALHY
jgi:Dihydroxyacid dehydratase/phosphogluconate dehydratase